MTDFRQIGLRVEAMLEEVRALPDAAHREKTEEIVRLLLELYGEGLRLMLESVKDSPGADEVLEGMRRSPLVASLLVLHGLHPVPVEERIETALAGFRSTIDVKLLATSETTARVRLTAGGCTSSSEAVRHSIERAVLDAAPELLEVEFEEPRARLVQIEASP